MSIPLRAFAVDFLHSEVAGIFLSPRYIVCLYACNGYVSIYVCCRVPLPPSPLLPAEQFSWTKIGRFIVRASVAVKENVRGKRYLALRSELLSAHVFV